jgi:hypothetical protein
MVVALALVLAACERGQEIPDRPSAAPDGQVMRGAAAQLMSVPRSVLAECEEASELEIACPHLLPAIEGRYRAKTFDTHGADYVLLDISFSAPYPQLTERNAPPRFVHIVIKAGDLTEAFPFSFPSAPPSPPEPPKRYQEAPLTFGRFTWGAHEGLLVLAPKFPVGGIDGGHAIFSWTKGQTESRTLPPRVGSALRCDRHASGDRHVDPVSPTDHLTPSPVVNDRNSASAERSHLNARHQATHRRRS